MTSFFNKSLIAVFSFMFMTAAGMAQASDNPFGISASADQVQLAGNEGKCGSSKCGESKCGGSMKKESKENNGKCGEGKCGGSMKKESNGKCGSTEKKESKCGSGKCGGQ